MAFRRRSASVFKAEQVRTQHGIAAPTEFLAVRVHHVPSQANWLGFPKVILIRVLMDRQHGGPAFWWDQPMRHEQPG